VTTTKRKKGAEHCVMGGAGVRCLNCGEEQAIPYPCALQIAAAVCETFEKMHRQCKPSEAGAARFKYADVGAWLASWDTGISSKTIYHVLRGTPWSGPFRPDVPHDPDDFGRCYRLLKVAPPEWRANLARVAERFPAWAPLVARWDDLTRLYEEEEPTGKAPKLYALMRELLGSAS
jgi:hypothetical protein